MSHQFGHLFENDLVALLPEIFIALSALCLLVYGVLFSIDWMRNFPLLLPNMAILTIFVLVLAMVLLANSPIKVMMVLNKSLVLDHFAWYMKMGLLLTSVGVLAVSLRFFDEEQMNTFEYAVLILLSILSMMLLVSANDLISMYLLIEFQSLCFYVLASSKRVSEFSTEAGLKYFILGAFSSGILLFGCSLLYGSTGITHFDHFAMFFTDFKSFDHLAFGGETAAICVGLLFLTVGFLFKLGAAPFHMWLPDVYEGAPTSVTLFFATVPKLAILGLMVRLYLEVFEGLIAVWMPIMIFASLLSMLVGSFGALGQTKIKRMLAYSSVGHVGYMLMGFASGAPSQMLLYMGIYLVMTLNVFTLVLSLRSTVTKMPVRYLSDLSGLSQTNPLAAFGLALIMFSMAGIPPLAGFVSKVYLFFTAIGTESYVLAFFGVLTSVVSCFYYLRVVKIMYFEASTSEKGWFVDMNMPTVFVLTCTSLFIIFLCVYPEPIIALSVEMIHELIDAEGTFGVE